MVDDHAIDALKVWFEIEYEHLKKEWKSGQYGKLSECPSFKVTHTYKEAINILIKGTQYIDETELKQMIDEDLEIEELRKN